MLLPHKANNGQDDTRGMLGRLVAADDGAQALPGHDDHVALRRAAPGRCTCTPRSGSSTTSGWRSARANLNEHSLFNDTEVDVVTCDPALARGTRDALWAEHLERDDASGDPARLVDEHWRPIATEQLERRRSGAPLTHHLVELPGVSRRSRRLLGPLDASSSTASGRTVVDG